MFETHDDVMAMFEQFRSVDKADLGTSQALENHALLVMNALDEAISNMDDPEFLIDMLLTTGKTHQRFENFHPAIFWVTRLLHYYYDYRNICQAHTVKLVKWELRQSLCGICNIGKKMFSLQPCRRRRRRNVNAFSRLLITTMSRFSIEVAAKYTTAAIISFCCAAISPQPKDVR